MVKKAKELFDKKREAIAANEQARQLYVQRVRDAMVTSSTEMSKGAYIEALEELSGDLEAMLEAARDELTEEA